MVDFGRVIKEYRKRAGLKQTDLARKARITPTYLSKLENGRKYPSLPLLQKLCRFLGVPEEVLFWEAVEINRDLDRNQRKAVEVARHIIRKCFPPKTRHATA